MYSVQCTRRGAGRAALYRTVRGVLVTIGERSGADSVGGAAESESDGTGSVQCCDLCWVQILVTEVMELTMKCDAGPSSSDGGRGVVLARKKLI